MKMTIATKILTFAGLSTAALVFVAGANYVTSARLQHFQQRQIDAGRLNADAREASVIDSALHDAVASGVVFNDAKLAGKAINDFKVHAFDLVKGMAAEATDEDERSAIRRRRTGWRH